ncbi:hypothetical protein AJ85_04650 [Alkalihalobacillus alcalophilus ATCC 27647 = CGMCC 1.3604]|uniref:Uncharacterized protein n=1 Tax=Alkalihalobacillus alcalophilus ATCC 27647 = CGMCC 1.3604 TaxID=1218173 RepID=A0A094WNW1_ALKAL|nr:hypothetical protein [Alkalihalobacillus alcalophilus]KGA97653.1 hypothetical protein BALCAV_0208925 [Alkalihalobacillus alcalophilus ATCC 27647 = CGMCC 1.3604]MED1561312.1 hypothetical protein [Alkalihalobacillus alcalophilus]THG91475.1 hypothetical protein AJ85_04650 [Alkalihalobacillus alcalophilus ATCC 27647 = CGMCC 1.3604]
MSLATTSMKEVVLKQVLFRIKANWGFFFSLMVTQCVMMLLSMGSTISISSRSYNVGSTTNDVILVFTFIWLFVMGILLLSKSYRYDDFCFVTSNVSQSLANFIYLLFASIIGALTAFLAGYVQKVIMYFVTNSELIFYPSQTGFWDYIAGIIGMALYGLMFGLVGYLLGSLVQLNKSFLVIIPVTVVAIITLTNTPGQLNGFFNFLAHAYFNQSSFWLFSFNVLLTVILLMVGSVLVGKRLEVR